MPHASTCFYWLRLPRYSSAAVMAEKLLFAIEQCIDIDADFRVHDTDVAEQEAGPTLARVSSDEDNLFENFSHLR
ncbi:HECT-domain (ubiquitin-transferase) [Lotmaria passim]